MNRPTAERVVLLDEHGQWAGEADKRAVHHTSTPLHLAFSCYVLDRDGRLLVTRRALSKTTFPGVWTNSCCGHPAPGEEIEDAVVRRVRQELGLSLSDLRLLLPWFRYRAVMDSGVVENEMCPVYVATSGDDVRSDPDEVEEHRWEPWPEFRESVLAGRDVSSWCREQVAQLPEDLAGAAGRPRSELPPAARLSPTSDGYRRRMTTTPQEPDPDAEPVRTDEIGEPGVSPIPGEKQTPEADPEQPEYEHESRQRIEGGEPS
jgi:isopentenyl-diphosphate Delta-isomerase